MLVLGLNSLYHESAACLLHDGRIVAASEEERFTRVKHAKTPSIDNPDRLPLHAMHHCLEAAGIGIGDVDHVGWSSNPAVRLRAGTDGSGGDVFAANIARVPLVLRELGFRGEFHWIGHHRAHAASAFFASPFDEAATISVDGLGDADTTAWYHGAGARLRTVGHVRAPHSLGFLWELTSMYLGFDIYDATKIMGLAAYGDPGRLRAEFRRLVSLRDGGRFRVDPEVVRFDRLDYPNRTGWFVGFESLFRLPRRKPGDPLGEAHADVSAALQERTDEVLLHVARHAHEATGAQNLCLAGGVALNCVSNRRIFEEGPFDRLWVQPAAHDGGTAIGAALAIHHEILGGPRSAPMSDPYLGPEFSARRIEEALRRHGLRYERCGDVATRVAGLIAAGDVVGWHQGRMEIGPRALGNRSLLADPRDPGMREMLNVKVKHREEFRPFAPSVLAEEAESWFRIGKPTEAADWMLMAYPVRETCRERIPAVLHVDGTARVQLVRRETNPRYHRLISAFRDLTGVPLVLNTSFNDSEPIVCTPDDAIRTFLETRIDHLAIGDFLASRTGNPDARFDPARRPTAVLHRVLPEPHAALDRVLQAQRLSRLDGLAIVTDRPGRNAVDQVLPLFAEQEFFLDELDRERVRGARALEIGLGSGMLSIAVLRAGAERVVGLEVESRAKILAGFNALTNGCGDRLEIRDGADDAYRPVAGERFDFVFSNPPFVPVPEGTDFCRHSAAGPYGMDFVEKLLAGLDAHLTDGGFAEIVTTAAGSGRGPDLLAASARTHLSGRTTIRIAGPSCSFRDATAWLPSTGFVSAAQSEELRRRARRDGVTHLHLCVLHYDRRGPRRIVVERARKTYPEWHLPRPGIDAERPIVDASRR